MSKYTLRVMGLLVVTMFSLTPVQAQSPSPDTEAAARELVNTTKLTDRFKTLMPMLMQNMKAAIVQNRAEIARDYDVFAPLLLKGMEARMGELTEAMVTIYSSNFTAAELRAVIAFYKTPAGQKFLAKTPDITQQSMLAGQAFGKSVADDMKKQMIEELRNKGHDL
jgi:hypothetical protein